MVFRFIMRILSVSALAIAVIVAVLDAARSIGASRLVTTSLANSWTSLSPGSFNASKAYVEAQGVPYLWDPIVTSLLSVPTAIALAVLAVVFYMLGHKREHPASRYALR
jgi:hypothetical protein